MPLLLNSVYGLKA